MELVIEFSSWLIPLLLFFVPLIGLAKGVKVYEAFVTGAAEGFTTAIRIMPYLVAMMVATSIFRSSGALEAITQLLSPLCEQFHIPNEVIPLAIMRPLSGSGALGMAADVMQNYGPDSFIGRLAAVMVGSTDTTFYVLTVYFGAVKIVKPRYSVLVGLCGDLIGLVASIYFCQKFFG